MVSRNLRTRSKRRVSSNHQSSHRTLQNAAVVDGSSTNGTTIPSVCARYTTSNCSSTTHHSNSVIRHEQRRCCRIIAAANKARTQISTLDSTCLCLPVAGSTQESCLCLLPTVVKAESKHCFCQFTRDILAQSCNCNQSSFGKEGQDCSCSVGNDRLVELCSCQSSPSPYGEFGGTRVGKTLCTAHAQPLL